MSVGVRTVDMTATSGTDYNSLDQSVHFDYNEMEKEVEVEIIDDDQWEPDVDFVVELYDLTSHKRLKGEDTLCKVTIIDDDEPGILSLHQRHLRVRGKDEIVVFKIVRQ